MATVKERRRIRKKAGNGHVVLPRKQYERLLEDLHDLAIIAERRNEPAVGFEEVVKSLQKRGRL